MSYGLINQGQQTKSRAMGGLRQSAQEEQQRDIANANIDQAESQAKKSNAAAGASTGAAVGGSMAASAGLGTASVLASGLATGGIGLAAGLLLSELF